MLGGLWNAEAVFGPAARSCFFIVQCFTRLPAGALWADMCPTLGACEEPAVPRLIEAAEALARGQ